MLYATEETKPSQSRNKPTVILGTGEQDQWSSGIHFSIELRTVMAILEVVQNLIRKQKHYYKLM